MNVRAGQIEQGGSTLTQQLVRSYFLSSRQTLSRKLREAIMAMALDAHFSKADLMNAYINEIFLGQDGDRAIHGFGLASQFYFGKPLAELDLPEVALLVAVVRGPSYYDPRRHPDRALARRNLVLKMLADQRRDAGRRCERCGAARRSGSERGLRAPTTRRTWTSCAARCAATIADTDLTEAGLSIYTSLEPRAQEQAESALERELARLDRARRHPDAHLEGAVVVTAPQSGDVIAIVGGRDVGYDGFDRALDARRSMGSLVKPFIYLTALESGRYTAATVVQDAAGRRETRQRHALAAGELHPPDLRPGAGGARAVRVAESRHRWRRPRPRGCRKWRRRSSASASPGHRRSCRRCCSAQSTSRRWRWRSSSTGSLTAASTAPLRAVRAVVGADGKALKAFPHAT